MKNSTVLAYEGGSLIDGEPILVIVSGLKDFSQNRKTGPLVQTWILARDTHPTVAVQEGKDRSICGDCPLRGVYDPKTGLHGRQRVCYVRVEAAPTVLWRRWQENLIPAQPLERIARAGAGRIWRLGSYGDPSAAPVEVWERLTAKASAVLGYTHLWRSCDPRLARFCMASVESPEEREEAKAKGWRTFRVRGFDQAALPGEATCPASAEAGHKLMCFQCRACNGTATGLRGDIVIAAHGTAAKISTFHSQVREMRIAVVKNPK